MLASLAPQYYHAPPAPVPLPEWLIGFDLFAADPMSTASAPELSDIDAGRASGADWSAPYPEFEQLLRRAAPAAAIVPMAPVVAAPPIEAAREAAPEAVPQQRPKRTRATSPAVAVDTPPVAAAVTKKRKPAAAAAVTKKQRKVAKPANAAFFCAGPDAEFLPLEVTLLLTAVAQNRCATNDRCLLGIAWAQLLRRVMAGEYGILQRRVRNLSSKVLQKKFQRMLDAGEVDLDALVSDDAEDEV